MHILSAPPIRVPLSSKGERKDGREQTSSFVVLLTEDRKGFTRSREITKRMNKQTKAMDNEHARTGVSSNRGKEEEDRKRDGG